MLSLDAVTALELQQELGCNNWSGTHWLWSRARAVSTGRRVSASQAMAFSDNRLLLSLSLCRNNRAQGPIRNSNLWE